MATAFKYAIGIFPSRQQTILALNELRLTGFPMNRVFTITKQPHLDSPDNSAATNQSTINPVEAAKSGAVAGSIVGGLLAFGTGLGVLLVPGVGPVLAAESVVALFLGSGASAAAGGLIGALQGWSLPKTEQDLASPWHYLVTVEGTENEIRFAAQVLHRWGIQKWRVYNAFSKDGED